MPWQGARIYKAAPLLIDGQAPATSKPGEETNVELNSFYTSLFSQVFGDKPPKELKSTKRVASGKGSKTKEVEPWGDIPNNAFTALTFGGVSYDYGGFVPSDKNDRLIVPRNRVVDVRAKLHTGTGVKTGGFIYAWLTRSDMESLDMQVITYTQGQDNVTPPLMFRGSLAKGDYLRVVILHALGKPLPEGTLKFGTWMEIEEIGEVEAVPPPQPEPGPTPNPVGEEDEDDDEEDEEDSDEAE